MSATPDLSVQVLISAYAQGVFPMGDELGEINWYEADPRGVLPLERFHLPHDLRRVLRQEKYGVTLNREFERVIRCCASIRDTTWITEDIISAYSRMHRAGYAHSVESWDGDELAGGLYGVAIGGAFFGESMFYLKRDASKVALAHLASWLSTAGFTLFDIQMMTDLLKRFGAELISKDRYKSRLVEAIRKPCRLIQVPVTW